MQIEIPKVGAIVTLICFVAGIVVFFLFNSSFGGPALVTGLIADEPYTLQTEFDDAEGLLQKSLVLVRGVPVGEVESVETLEDGRADVRFSVEDRYAPISDQATARLGQRTVFGEKYVDLNTPLPGSEAAGLAPGQTAQSDALSSDKGSFESGDEVRATASIPVDEALEVLGDKSRQDLIDTLGTLARGTRSREAPVQLNETIAGLSGVVGEVRALTDVLRGQEDDIAGLVDGSRTAFSALGEREDSLRRIVSSGRTTLEAVASRREALGETFDELPPTLDLATGVLARSRPLLVEAQPLLEDVAAAAPALRGAIEDFGPVSGSFRALIAELEPARRSTVPILREVLPDLRATQPAVEGLEPALRNLVPAGRYLGKREREAAAFFSNVGATAQDGDSTGGFARLFLFFNQDQASGQAPPAQCSPDSEPAAAGFCNNAYPDPGDGLDNQPFDGYPRLQPFDPPPRRGGR